MRSRSRWLLAAACLGLLSGCFGKTHNPAYFPNCGIFGDIVRTHAKPGGHSYFNNFDRHACRMEVRPIESTNPVHTQHVLIATIYDEKGQPRRGRRVEWILEGVGNIVEVDESGIFNGRGYKVDNKYAVSYTDYKEHCFDRGNLDPNDDFTIRPGQSWCVVTSPVEGDTHITVYAPEIYNWDNHKVFVTKHWVDAEWRVPPPAVARVGTEHIFTTQVWRQSDRQPLAGYRVRYRILDGPPAVFLPSRTQEAIAVSDINGNASAALVQLEPRGGVNRVAVEIIRAPDPSLPSSAGIVVGRGETRMEWQGPQVGMKMAVPPGVPLSQEVPFTITVSNSGAVGSTEMTVRDVIPEGLQFIRSEPPAIAEGNQLVWTLGGLPGGQTHTINAYFKSTKPGVVTNVASVQTRDGLREETQAATQVTVPGLEAKMTGPQTAVTGVPLTFDIVVTNSGTGPVSNVSLLDEFDAGLEHESKAARLNLPVGTLGPSESKTVQLTLTPRQEGRLVNRVTALGDGGLKANAEYAVTVQKATLRIETRGPERRYLNRPADWNIVVSNTGQTPLSNLVVRNQLPAELTFVSADQGGTLTGTEIVWNLGAIQPGEQKTVQARTTCAKMTPRALHVAVATADPGLRVQSEAAIQILGLPAFQLQVSDASDPVEVGGRTSYRIGVLNQGSLSGSQVQVKAVVPKQFRIINATGPTQPQVNGTEIVYPPVAQLPAGQQLNYVVEVQALEPSDVRFRVELRGTELKDEVIDEESTTIFAPSPGPPSGLPPLRPDGGRPQ